MHDGRLMIRQSPDSPGHAHVIGSLTGDNVHLLFEAVSSGARVLDLSEVSQVDHAGVRALDWLWPEQCALVGCPRWLELWLSRSRRNAGQGPFEAAEPPDRFGAPDRSDVR